jgi:hypothetical protein
MEELQKLQRKKKAGKVRGYMGTREFFLGKEKDVYINRRTTYRKQIGSWEGRKRISKRKTIF